ncbi:MAG: DHH family phosphoesterase [Oscillospiraceae bacterium]|jgi:c-di-AMP phosphodiesterase-like protein|nr:DHH family phosphoesterase [Oscillospiraceae bacterium]
MPRFFKPSMRLYFAFLVIFTLISAAFDLRLTALLALLVILLMIYTRLMSGRQKKEVLDYFAPSREGEESASASTLINMPLPTVIFSLATGTVLWSNELFLNITNDREHMFEVHLEDVLPGFSRKWLAEGAGVAPQLVEINKSKFRVYGNSFSIGDGDEETWSIIYLVDVTEYEKTEKEYRDSRPIMTVIMLDNYDELFKSLTEAAKNTLLAAIDSRISEWCAPAHGYLWRYDRDRYIFIFEERYLKGFIDDRFSVLDRVRELQNGAGIAATLSIGMGREADTLDEAFQFAMLGIDMALSRGGDQAVIKNKLNFEFYGGHSVAMEKRTKVKSRVMANAMGELTADASKLMIMGHKISDMDSIGAAAAICCIARKLKKPAYIVVNQDNAAAKPMIDKLKHLPEYEGVFISESEAMSSLDGKTLLVVVDTNRPEQVESELLLESCSKIAVIDHHRRAADYIDNAALNFHEPYASSACELATELLQYLVDVSDILKAEAEAILAGIMLDTKKFTMRTGSRTFEAAAFLRRAGSDTAEVKKLFQSDMKSARSKYSIIKNVVMYRDGIAIATGDGRMDRVIAAQAADDLLDIYGVTASFVICSDGDETVISARSLGDVNVQFILEKLGGGGNKSAAGAQIKGKSPEETITELKEKIDEYLKEN